MENKIEMQTLINHLKQFGFVFQGSEIYGGLANTWDYGPLGVLLKKNIQDLWWDYFITKIHNNFAIDSKILLNPNVWQVSGHTSNFNDLLIENKVNKKRYRVDHLFEENFPNLNFNDFSQEKILELLKEKVLKYDNSATRWEEIKQFNLMFETQQGVVEDKKSKIFLRPETAQGIFINFKNIQRSMRLKLPFGIGQIGKSFRNEITPGNFIFRTREFEQMELEIFCHPEQANQIFDDYLNKIQDFLFNELKINKDLVRVRHHKQEELAHYSLATSDIEFLFLFGWGELIGLANRSDFDLKAHSAASGEKLDYLDPFTNQKFFPYIIEPSMGVDRLLLAVLTNFYKEEKLEENEEKRSLLALPYSLSPFKVAILPLVKKLSPKALEIYNLLLKNSISATFDENNSIGKRYRIQDAIGTYFSITVDYQSLEDNTITIRERDSMKQSRIAIDQLLNFLEKAK
ncbi:Glycyl-tRNA synthetase [Mesomycoplasma hyorhinis SK76]|uniref:glycine--tRNA ligase n=1 Tax=Mesomycoplasma hyorhinis SK76 TaxID=1118964 RepID=A0AAI8AN09_MESHY|nr:Glycyl-tRNA synthetase [Mesomycoplasma hyorhinis SK76]